MMHALNLCSRNGKQRQADHHEFQASLVYVAFSDQPKLHSKVFSKNKTICALLNVNKCIKRSSSGNNDPRAVNYEGRKMQRVHLSSAIPICTNS